MRGKSQAEIAAIIRSRMPKDVPAQQKKVAAADALAFIAPVHFCSFPSILKGWIDRVFTLDFAFGLTSEGSARVTSMAGFRCCTIGARSS